MINLHIHKMNYIPYLLLLMCSMNIYATDLLQAYTLAEYSDPRYREEIASFQATLEAKPLAQSRLLPDINLNGNTTLHNEDISFPRDSRCENIRFSLNNRDICATVGSDGEGSFTRRGYSLNITQPIYHYDRYIAMDQADSRIKQAQAVLDTALQDLIIRVSERYFNVLAAMDNLEFVHGEKKSLSRQLDQAKQRFEVGLTAITDVAEAQAGFDRAVANEISAENLLDDTREQLREIVGEYFTTMAPLGNSMPLVSPEPADIEAWTETSQQQNLNIVAAKFNLEIARQEIRIQSAGHLPTLDLVARHGFDTSGSVRFGGTEIEASIIGLEMNLPIYSGGRVNSLTREAHQRYNEAREQLEQQYRSAQRQTREGYRGVISGISQVKAFEQALISTETALLATQAGFEVGTRTAVDVVASERATLEAKRDHARARYTYILNSLRLKRAAGTLSPDDLNQINSWLE